MFKMAGLRNLHHKEYVMKKLTTFFSLALFSSVMLITSTVSAGSISDFDLNQFDFDVINVTGANTGVVNNAVATGTSNSVGWTISPTTYWMNRTKTDGSFNFSALPVSTDNLHASGDYTITFDQTISSLLVALSNDNLRDSINFGLVASDFSGVSFVGTQVVLDSARGGLVLFENINSLTIQNVNNNQINDGYDLAFHAVVANPSAVPIPAAAFMFAPALLGFLGLRRRAKSTAT